MWFLSLYNSILSYKVSMWNITLIQKSSKINAFHFWACWSFPILKIVTRVYWMWSKKNTYFYMLTFKFLSIYCINIDLNSVQDLNIYSTYPIIFWKRSPNWRNPPDHFNPKLLLSKWQNKVFLIGPYDMVIEFCTVVICYIQGTLAYVLKCLQGNFR